LSRVLARLSSFLGPAAVMAAGTMGAGAMASFLLAGAWFRYELLWVIPAMLPVFVVSADSASRIGALNPTQGLFTLTRRHISSVLAWLILLVVVPVHFLVSMGQISVMSSAVQSLLLPAHDLALPPLVDSLLAVALAAGTLWLVLSRGYQRMQRVMTALMILMLLCFLLVALRGFAEWPAILRGLLPSIPADLPVPGGAGTREASTSIIAMLGSAIAPAALLGLPYLSADAGTGPSQLSVAFRQSVLNLGLLFGVYAMLVVIAGGYALFVLPGHAALADVRQASQVLQGVFPGLLAPLGPLVFSLGLFVAALTTLVVASQVTVYFVLDMLGRAWRFTEDNRRYHRLLAAFMLAAAVLAPLWDFPALLKVILLMGINVVVIPLVYLVVILLANRSAVMGGVRTAWWRNALLLAGLLVSIALAVEKAPQYARLLLG
jgi:Mn2+/Fe2+ NRAMP family transporter